MRFYYASQSDLLGIQLKPGPEIEPAQKNEVMPGVWMGFDGRKNLVVVEIKQASKHDPNLPNLVGDLVGELARNSGKLAQEALLSIEKTLKLSELEPNEQPPEYSPHFSFDAVSNLIHVGFFRPESNENLMPKTQVLPDTLACFDQQGYLVSIEIHNALQQFPDLRRFIEQGQEIVALQHMFNS